MKVKAKKTTMKAKAKKTTTKVEAKKTTMKVKARKTTMSRKTKAINYRDVTKDYLCSSRLKVVSRQNTLTRNLALDHLPTAPMIRPRIARRIACSRVRALAGKSGNRKR